MEYAPPAGTSPLVAMADMDVAVVIVIMTDRKTISNPSNAPATPEIHGSLRKEITPKMFWRHGRKTPVNVERLLFFFFMGFSPSALGMATLYLSISVRMSSLLPDSSGVSEEEGKDFSCAAIFGGKSTGNGKNHF